MRLVAGTETFRHVADRDGNLYLRPRAIRCYRPDTLRAYWNGQAWVG